MITFQTVAMTIVKGLCVILILKEACYGEAQKQGSNWYIGQNRFQPYQNEGNSLISHVISHTDRPQLVKRKLDRFRFFHKGLGKRTVEPVFDNTEKINDIKSSYSTILVELQSMLNVLNKFENMIPGIQQYILTKHPDFLSEEMKSLRNMQGTKHRQSKRAPEVFSENLYPLQSGKQELEATLDQTLNSNEDDLNNNLDDFDHSSTNEASESNLDQISNELHNEKMATNSPFDLYFASPDLEMDDENQTQDKNKVEDIKDKINNGQRSKRWWAANMFSKFRSPKSWNRRVSKTIHADPAIYFLGLGR